MSQTIDIETIKNANSNISAMTLTQKWAQTFKKYALEEDEELTDDPANSFNIFLHLTAQGAAKMMYEQAARKNEFNESTAILPKSLLNKMTSDELAGIFGFPASTTIVYCVKKDDILKNSVIDDPLTGSKKLILNKNMSATFESHASFILPYDVEINVKPIKNSLTGKDTNNIYAHYVMPPSNNDGMRNVYKIYNQYISSREMRFEGETYIAFFLKVYQLHRQEKTFYVSDPNTADNTIKFDGSLVAFEVFKQKSNSHDKKLMKGFTEGTTILNNDSYNYSYDYKRNSKNFNVIFSKMNDRTSLDIGDTISIVTYTTLGSKGNIKFPYMVNNLNQMIVNYDQDVSDKYQNPLLNIVALVFARDSESTGGTDQLTIDEIRNKIINKKYSRNVLITSNEIENKARELGLDIYKEEHDVINMYFRGIDKITYKNMILSTGTNNFYFDLTKKKKLLPGYNYYLIEPTDVFCYDKENNKFFYKPRISDNGDNLESYQQYVDLYNKSNDVDSIMQVSFPFYIRYENTVNPKIQIYNMFVKDTQYLTFTDYNENLALDKLDISYLQILRNPYIGSVDGGFDKDLPNTYFLKFIVYTGTNTLNKIYDQCHNIDESKNYVNSLNIDNYKKQYITFDVKMVGAATNEVYQINPINIKIINTETMLDDKYIAYQIAITTNNFITTNKQLQMSNIRYMSNISTSFDGVLPVDTTVKFVISGRFNSETQVGEKDCITYESDNVKLVEYMTDELGIDFDIESVIPGYKTYSNDVPKMYDHDEYYLNKNYSKDSNIIDERNPDFYEYAIDFDNEGKPIFYTDGNTVVPKFKIKHKKGDIVYDYIPLTDEEIKFGPLTYKQYFLADNDTYLDTRFYEIKTPDKFKEGVNYYTRKSKLKHHKGEYKWFKKNSPINMNNESDYLVDLPENLEDPNINYEKHPLPLKYIGVLKNVSWINRLYFSGEEMYEYIVNSYINLIDRIKQIKSLLFDGGLVRAGLKRTSGSSKKYKAYFLSTNNTEYINNIALKLTYRVKFKENNSIDYKKQQIIDTTVKHIENIGDKNLSIDGLFEDIKSAVPDIEYINIININEYRNGEVQTIMNDPTITNEVLTVSQKIYTDKDGNIDFEPDITVDVVNSEI